MSDRPRCSATGKICFRGKHEARLAHQHAGYRIRIYECPDCGAHHVTNDEKRRNSHSQGGSQWDGNERRARPRSK